MNVAHSPKSSRGFTYVELVTAVVVITAIAGICLTALGHLKERSDAAKLRSDIAAINSAVKLYQANGGTVPVATDHLAILARLKSTITEEQQGSHVGLRGTMLDSRVTVQMMTEEEESTSDPRAVWNSAAKKFQIAYAGSGIKRFVLGDVVAATQDLRSSPVEYSSVSNWVWDYRDSPTSRPDYSEGFSTYEEDPDVPLDAFGNPRPPSWSAPETLIPPIISLPTGFYEAASYPLSLTLTNPNPEGSSMIYYKFDDEEFRPYYGSPISVEITFSTKILAYARALNPDQWSDSTAVSSVYETLFISGDVHGKFTPPGGGTDKNAVQQLETTDDYSKFTWGRPADMSDHTASSLQFTGEKFTEIVPEADFILGTLSYYNGGNHGSTGVDELDLVLDLQLTVNIPIADENLLITFDVITTPDHKWASKDENSDYVEMLAVTHEFVTTINGVIYYLVISFDYVEGDGYIEGNEFHVHEDGTGQVKIVALLTPDPDGLDQTAPTVNLAYTSSLRAGTEQDPHFISGPVNLEVTFSENVTGFTLSDVQVVGGTATAVTGSGADYVVSMTPNGSGLITANVTSGAVLDSVGHGNLISNVVYFHNDQIPPGLEITVDSTDVFRNFWATITASEAVTGFTYNDIVISNGSIVSFGANGGNSFNAEIEPIAVGDIVFSIPASVLTDTLGNGNLASNVVTVLYRLPDITPPTATLAYTGGTQPEPGCADVVVNVHTDNYPRETSWTFTDSNGDVVASHGSYSTHDTDYAHSYCLASGDYSLTIDDSYGDGICCAQGNGSYSVSVDGTMVASGGTFGASETADFTIATIDPFYITGPVTVALTFDEEITGLTIDDLSVSNGTVTSFAGTGTAYTFTATPNGGGTMSIELPADAVDDLSGNGNAGSDVLYLEIDSVSPIIELSTTSSTVDAPFEVTGLGSEAMLGLTAADITVTNGTVSEFSATGGALYDFIVTPDASGTVTIHVPANAYTDLAGNSGAASNTLEVEFIINVPYINFNDHTVGYYIGDSGTYTVSDEGLTLKIEDNAWKKIDYAYTVTANTIIEFEFRSDKQGEIHGIGFDDNLWPSSSLTIQLYGSQNWGSNTYQNYSAGGGWKSYSIPVGQEYTGDFNHLFFVADHDQSPGDGESEFRNIRVFEQSIE